MFSFFKKKPAPTPVPADAPAAASAAAAEPCAEPAGLGWLRNPFASPAPETPAAQPAAPAVAAPAAAASAPPAGRTGWLLRLKSGLRKPGSSIGTVFTGTQIDDALYEELETALLLADTGVMATGHLLAELKRRVKERRATDPAAVKALLAEALAELLRPLEKTLVIGAHRPTVIMVAGVNGAGKTTSIGKLTKHL